MTLLNNILPEKRRGKLKALLEMGNTVRVLEAHNGLSGIIANNIQVEGESKGKPIIREFDAIWESSLTDSASKGHPDIEVAIQEEMLTHLSIRYPNSKESASPQSLLKTKFSQKETAWKPESSKTWKTLKSLLKKFVAEKKFKALKTS